MGTIIIQPYTTKIPLQMIGEQAGICWNSNTTDEDKNKKRAVSCINSGHGRVMEFPDVYMIMEGYSARVIREWYTHLGGAPTRLQASTRYINYEDFDYIVPHSIRKDKEATVIYNKAMHNISKALRELEYLGIPKEDSALLLPLGMTTKIVCKHNLRNLVDMSHQRMCSRAYWEYRELFADLRQALSEYSDEWKYLVDYCFKPKCEMNIPAGCPEEKGCGKYPKLNNKK